MWLSHTASNRKEDGYAEDMGAIQRFRQYRVLVASGAWSAAIWAVQTMYPNLMPQLAPWALGFGLVLLVLTALDIVAVRLNWLPDGKLVYAPLGFRWLKKKAERTLETILNEPHFLSFSEAVSAVKQSKWARSRKAETEKPINMMAALGMWASIVEMDPAKKARDERFVVWCGLVLDNFERDFPLNVKMREAGKKEYDQSVLENWLEDKYRATIIAEFGDPF